MVDEHERLCERSFSGDCGSGPIGEDIDDGAVIPAGAQLHDEPSDVALECADAMRVDEVTELVEVRIHTSMMSAPIDSVQRLSLVMIIGIPYARIMLHDVEIRQLRALHAVAAEGSFGRAADRLGFTQSAISQQIAGLERAVGDRVFDRPGGPRRVELTPTGVLVLAYAESLFDQMRAAEDGLQSLRAGEVGRLSIGSFQSVSVNVLPTVIGRLRAERPGLSVRCVEDDDNDRLVEKLLADELDLTFLVGAPDHDGVESIELVADPFVLLAPASQPDRVVRMSSLDGAALIGQSPCFCQGTIDACLRSQGVEPDYVFLTNDNAAVQAMVRAGMGRAILPFLAVDQYDPGVTVASLEPEVPPRIIHLARRRGRTLAPAADRFTELAAAVCAALPQFDPHAAVHV